MLITVNSKVPDLAQFRLLSLVSLVTVVCVIHCIRKQKIVLNVLLVKVAQF